MRIDILGGMGMETKEKAVQAQNGAAKGKKSRKKVWAVVIGVLLAVIVVAVAFIELSTLPRKDTADDVIYIGGMVSSDTVEYADGSGKGLLRNPVVKIMQMVWRYCDGGDKAKHAAQNPPTVTEVNDLAYIEDGNLYHTLDVLYPADTQPGAKLPVIIDIHGGGWMYAEKGLNHHYCAALADRGYVVFNINYRLVPDVTVNQQLQDVARALRWIRDHGSQYPCDMRNIMLTGDSAGGQLAAYSAVLMQSAQLRKTFDTVDPQMELTALLLTSPVAFMRDGGLFSLYTKPMWGTDYKDKATYPYMDFDQIIGYAQALPPTYLITSSGDTLANKQTHRLYEVLQAHGVQAEIKDYAKAEYNQSLPHVFSVLQPFEPAGTAAIDKALAFYQQAMTAKAAQYQDKNCTCVSLGTQVLLLLCSTRRFPLRDKSGRLLFMRQKSHKGSVAFWLSVRYNESIKTNEGEPYANDISKLYAAGRYGADVAPPRHGCGNRK